MTECGGVDVVDSFTDPVKRGGRSNSQISHGHIVVNGAYEADNLEMRVSSRLRFVDLSYSKISETLYGAP